MSYEDIPGLIGVYKISGSTITKVYGQDLKLNSEKLLNILMENMRIGEEESRKIGLGSFMGFAMILDNLGIAYLNNTIILVDAVKTNWSKVVKELEKGVISV
ncbi:hypothetical protein [Acidianus brierleyi]|uniref:Uncharacterized protein n=1 Tax=Acidianus brierleyi TaxID=41673 RepID=A0A2U9IIQ2_9CREN|nr:hypothetical protein [Acidianus brierleyi]AWR95814.1 hypothetical protein DFR85_15740 [Acidianus brierleyi]